MNGPFDLESLRDHLPEPADGGEATRLRIHDSVKRGAVHARRLRTSGVAGAVMVGTVALTLLLRSEPVAPRRVEPSPRVDVPAAPVPLQAPEPVRSIEAHHGAPREAGKPRRPARARPPSGVSAGEPVRESPTPVPAAKPSPLAPEPPRPPHTAAELHALYMTAHRLQFRGTPHQALAAWDAYLAGDPSGPPAAEARFNRALALVRLGRNDEARAALGPFAAGRYGAFRQRDAQRLLDALR